MFLTVIRRVIKKQEKHISSHRNPKKENSLAPHEIHFIIIIDKTFKETTRCKHILIEQYIETTFISIDYQIKININIILIKQ